MAICSLAWPRGLFVEHGVRVDEELAALEDWDLLLQAIVHAPVHDVDAATSIYRWWTDESGSKGSEQAAGWEAARRRVLARLGARPLVVQAEQVDGLVGAAEELSELDSVDMAAEKTAANVIPTMPTPR